MTDANFAALPPVPTSVEVGGQTIDITPLKVGELPAFARAVRPVAQKLSAEPDWLLLLSVHGDAVLDAVSIACRRPREWVAGLDIDDAIRLAEAIFEANADFFIRRVVPQVTSVSSRINQLIPGATPSSDSSPTVTATPIS